MIQFVEMVRSRFFCTCYSDCRLLAFSSTYRTEKYSSLSPDGATGNFF